MARGSDEWRKREWGEPCNAAHTLHTIQWSPEVRLYIDKRAEIAFRALYDVMHAHGYRPRPGVTGSYNCRKVTGGSYMSSHAWGIALDVNWDVNAYRHDRLVTDLPKDLIQDVLDIRTKETGAQVWRWGGDWDADPETIENNYDAMHFEIVATPEELAEGLTNEPTPVEPDPIPVEPEEPEPYRPVLTRGDFGPFVGIVQDLLGVPGIDRFGPLTEAAVVRFQTQHGLLVDGVVGPNTWKRLIEHERGQG